MKGNYTHGMSNTREYHSWEKMKERCMNPRNIRYPRWGGRGIEVCDRWMRFENFIADMGECPEGYQLDRIDNDGNYEPENCRWASREEQMNNRSCCIYVEYEGRKQTIAQWARERGFKFQTLLQRIKHKGELPPYAFRPVHTK